ncbi:hypothetical protein DAPPUDRAFT_270910 [Daphnia pulex]|uniref:Uncharacterized protein n=1 Tax=Daphnia pulex TaxID=6669 RepID=E9I1H5_DAPPU|nr:hypothetical protein DAPPUDRAFT_270910 [Daphnia pulex]|eukprot:EFX62155.1 hypothetical protein DAPPUDRAFT_270910 [Daphnia pulex]
MAALVEPIVSKMAPKFARTIIKRHLTRIIHLAEAYETTVMTSEAFKEAVKLEKKLNGFLKTYEIFSERIQDAMYTDEDADQEMHDADVNTMYQTKDEGPQQRAPILLSLPTQSIVP